MQSHVFGSSTLKALLEDPNLKNPPVIGLLNDHLKVKKEDASDRTQFNYGSAFLGPNLWDKSLDNSDFNLEYMDLDEFLSENGISVNNDDVLSDLALESGKAEDTSTGVNASPCQFPHSPYQHLKPDSPSPHRDYKTSITQLSTKSPSPPVNTFTVDFQINEQDIALASLPGEQGFDPRVRNFTAEELKPQPIVKKAKKIFIPDELKDEKYWARRHKNNFAARRSRDARRVKDNQIAIRASFLEKENVCLREEMMKLQKENAKLKSELAKFETTLQTGADL